MIETLELVDVNAVLSQLREHTLSKILGNIVPKFKEASEKKDYYAHISDIWSTAFHHAATYAFYDYGR